MIKERAFRTEISTKDDPIQNPLPIDVPEEGELEVLRSKLKREARYTVGGGRVANIMSEVGYDMVDTSIPFYLQTAKLLAAVMGACVTTGTSYAPAMTGTISAGGGTATLTLSVGGMTPDAHIGDMLVITAGDEAGSRFEIIDNDATTITLDVLTNATINNDTYEIVKAPFTHVITAGTQCNIPTYGLKYVLPNACDSDESIYNDMLGIIMKSIEVTIEKGGDAIQNVGIIGAKSVEGDDEVVVPSDFLLDLLKWGHVSEFVIEYDSEEVIVADTCDSIKISVENDAEIKHVLGDFYPNYKKYGTLEDTFTAHYFPRTRRLYDLVNTPLVDYVTEITMSLILTYSVDRFIQFAVNSLMLNDHPTNIPSKEDSILGVDAEFKLMPRDNPGGLDAGALTITAKDALGLKHYEGSTLPDPVL